MVNNACSTAKIINTYAPNASCNGRKPMLTMKFAVQFTAIAIEVAAGRAD